jgi:hypothetical protein
MTQGIQNRRRGTFEDNADGRELWEFVICLLAGVNPVLR